MTEPEAEKLLEKVAAQLGEHFDSVQIMATWNEEEMSKCVKTGCGNWYARQGMAHEFINEDVAERQAHGLAAVINDDDGDEGEFVERFD